ncbi:MAG: hypothetical protein GXP29_09070 [Planctomycetes bacterium]|nr:hypothetical protein [Planctomycetota bacterium]
MKANRNSLCPCGSGKKVKRCCSRAGEPRSNTRLHIPMQVVQRTESTHGQIRHCEECDACCGKALTINDPDLVSLCGEMCGFLDDSGCSIHGPRMPKTCSGFICSYLVEPGNLTSMDRPDHVGAIVRLVRNRNIDPPMDRVLYLNECKADGFASILKNQSWGTIIRNDLLAGIPLLCSHFGDSLAREVIHFRYTDGTLRCELTSCRSDGTPILQTREPVHVQPIEGALMIPQGFALDARILTQQLGADEDMVVNAATPSRSTRELCFWFTNRQAQLAQGLMRLIQNEPAMKSSKANELTLIHSV